jgi:excisionase family DNA binding protein
MNPASLNPRYEPLLRYREAAAELHVSVRTLQRYIDAGRIPVVTMSPRTKRVRRADLREFIHQGLAIGSVGALSSPVIPSHVKSKT